MVPTLACASDPAAVDGGGASEDGGRGDAAPPDASGPKEPTVEAYFNQPSLPGAQPDALFEKLVELVDGAPPGSIIRGSMYTLGRDNPVVLKLAEAHARGVEVQLVTNNGSFDSVAAETVLLPELGADVSASSWLGACGIAPDGSASRTRGGCHGAAENANNHNKFLTFSQTGGHTNVVWVGSSNLTSSQLRSWNNAVLFLDHPGMYARFDAVVDAFAAQIANPDLAPIPDFNAEAGGPAEGTPNGAYFAPVPTESGNIDFLESFIDKVDCVPGQDHWIRIAMHEFSNSRADFAERLAGKTDCPIRMVASQIGWRIRDVFKATEHMSYERYFASGSEKVPTRRIHHKYIIVKAKFAGEERHVVLTSSHNWSRTGIQINDESAVVVHGVGPAYEQDFQVLLADAIDKPVRDVPQNAEWGWCTTDAQCAGSCSAGFCVDP